MAVAEELNKMLVRWTMCGDLCFGLHMLDLWGVYLYFIDCLMVSIDLFYIIIIIVGL